MDQSSEQNKTEQPTPFKLKRAREKGMVAKGIDLGFFSTLAGLSAFALIVGDRFALDLSSAMRNAILGSPDLAHEPRGAAALWMGYGDAFKMLALLGLTIVIAVAFFEIVQVRGITFTTAPLKPDFSRLNPAKGLKRLFSTRMLKETVKNIVKLAVYAIAAYLVIKHALDATAAPIGNGAGLADAFRDSGFRLLFTFLFLALVFAILDQVIARGEFLKQMRMSRRELLREHKEREGEPLQKQKRRKMHAEFAKQARALGNLSGSDLLIVNPQHYAVALVYDPRSMTAPKVTAKGRNHFALLLRRHAERRALAIFERPALARALYRHCEKGDPVPAAEYRAVAELYLKLRRSPEADDAMA